MRGRVPGSAHPAWFKDASHACTYSQLQNRKNVALVCHRKLFLSIFPWKAILWCAVVNLSGGSEISSLLGRMVFLR